MLLCIVLDRGAAGPLMDTMDFRVTKHTLSWRKLNIMCVSYDTLYKANTMIQSLQNSSVGHNVDCLGFHGLKHKRGTSLVLEIT